MFGNTLFSVLSCWVPNFWPMEQLAIVKKNPHFEKLQLELFWQLASCTSFLSSRFLVHSNWDKMRMRFFFANRSWNPAVHCVEERTPSLCFSNLDLSLTNRNKFQTNLNWQFLCILKTRFWNPQEQRVEPQSGCFSLGHYLLNKYFASLLALQPYLLATLVLSQDKT